MPSSIGSQRTIYETEDDIYENECSKLSGQLALQGLPGLTVARFKSLMNTNSTSQISSFLLNLVGWKELDQRKKNVILTAIKKETIEVAKYRKRLGSTSTTPKKSNAVLREYQHDVLREDRNIDTFSAYTLPDYVPPLSPNIALASPERATNPLTFTTFDMLNQSNEDNYNDNDEFRSVTPQGPELSSNVSIDRHITHASNPQSEEIPMLDHIDAQDYAQNLVLLSFIKGKSNKRK